VRAVLGTKLLEFLVLSILEGTLNEKGGRDLVRGMMVRDSSSFART